MVDGTDGGLRWLLIDVGGVLEIVDDEAWPERFAVRWATVLGITRRAFSERLADVDLPDTARRSGVADEYWQRTGAALGATAEQTAAMRADFWDEYCGTLDDELLAFLAAQRGTIGLAILSNSGDGAREEEERRFGFAAVFDPIVYSHEIGVTKPDPDAFRIALDQMDAEPHEVLFVDNAPENVAAAEQLGLRAVLHVDTAATIAAVRAALAA